MRVNFTNESDIVTATKDFVFISYSHGDYNEVFDNLKVLDDNNINYWVDKELLAGDKWDETVLSVINHCRCKGAVLFLSPNYLRSEAAEKEIEYCFEKKRKENFVVSIVSINRRSVLGNIGLVFNSIRDAKDDEIQKIFPQERIYTITKYLEKSVLYAPNLVDCDVDNKQKFIDAFRKNVGSVFDDSKAYHKTLAEKMNVRNVDGVSEMELGLCPMARMDSDGYLLCEGYNFINGKLVYKRKGRIYLAQSVNWKIADINEDEIVLLSDKALFFTQPSMLNGIAEEDVPLKFDETYKCAIKGIGLFSIEDEEKFGLLLKGPLTYTQFAQDCKNKALPDVFIFDGQKKVAYNKMLKKIQATILETTFGYVYPCLKLNTKKFLGLEEKNG